MRKDALWTKNFCRVTAATALGAAGGILSGFALSFLVFDETGSTLASAVILACLLYTSVQGPEAPLQLGQGEGLRRRAEPPQ